MEIVSFENDIRGMCVTAEFFPEGALAAHQRLHAAVPFSSERGYYGISWPDGKGGITYKAAAQELEVGEAENLGFEIFVVKKGTYLSEQLPDFQKDIPAIGKTFAKLLADPRIDPQGYCLETYSKDAKDMQCLVKLKD